MYQQQIYFNNKYISHAQMCLVGIQFSVKLFLLFICCLTKTFYFVSYCVAWNCIITCPYCVLPKLCTDNLSCVITKLLYFFSKLFVHSLSFVSLLEIEQKLSWIFNVTVQTHTPSINVTYICVYNIFTIIANTSV